MRVDAAFDFKAKIERRFAAVEVMLSWISQEIDTNLHSLVSCAGMASALSRYMRNCSRVRGLEYGTH